MVGVACPADLERAHLLEVLALEEDPGPGQPVDGGACEHRSPVNVRADPVVGRADAVQVRAPVHGILPPVFVHFNGLRNQSRWGTSTVPGAGTFSPVICSIAQPQALLTTSRDGFCAG